MKSFSEIFRTKSTDSTLSKTQQQSQSPTNRKSTSVPPTRASDNGHATQGRKITTARTASIIGSAVGAQSVVGSTISAASTSNKESNLAKINALTGPEKAALEKRKQVQFKMASRSKI
jgi:hypothetical protein